MTATARVPTGSSPRTSGKFLEAGGARFIVRGVAYGTFAPDAQGEQFPEPRQLNADLDAIAAAGFNTIRTYTVPSMPLLDAAARCGLRVMAGVPWPQHMAFLDDPALVRTIRRDVAAAVRRLAEHPALLMTAIGNEIPSPVVRWHGATRVERFLRDLCDEARSASPSSLLTYVNFPPTEYLDLECFDICAFNVYLHREGDLRAYLARLQHIAGPRPLLLAEAGADSTREGADGQARLTAMHIRAALAEGACGAVAFTWTDDWWRGGQPVTDWNFGLVDRERRPKPALQEVARAFVDAPFAEQERARWPKVSVVVCAYNAADTIDDCLTSLAALTYPDVEVIVVNDGSRDSTAERVRSYPGARLIDAPHGGLSAARNAGLAAASGEVVAYTDADVRADPDWLNYLVQPFLAGTAAGAGGPNLVPADDPWMAQCVARAPGGPTHVLIDDRIAEHVPGCNMAFRRDALLAIGGFHPAFVRAGDDVDVCWRLQAAGHRIEFAPAALVWHHHRTRVEAFWNQQVGYGEAEAWLHVHHPDKFSGGKVHWRGRIYGPRPALSDGGERRINAGVWGTAAFPSVYAVGSDAWRLLPHSPSWMTVSTALLLAGAVVPSALGVPAAWLLLAGSLGWVMTFVRSVALATHADLRGLPAAPGGRFGYLTTIAWLHVIQPLARMRGRLRGIWSLPESGVPQRASAAPWQMSFPSLADAWRATGLIAGAAPERRFWSESWLAHTTLLTRITDIVRASRPAPAVEVDDGWHADRDVSVAVGRWGWLDLRVLIEEHAEGRCLVRAGLRLRIRQAAIVHAATLAALLFATGAAAARDWTLASVGLGALSALALARAAWQSARVLSLTSRALTHVGDHAGLMPLPAEPVAVLRRPWQRAPMRALQAAALIVTMLIAGAMSRSAADATEAGDDVTAASSSSAVVPGGGVAVGLAGDLFVADPRAAVIRRLRPRPPAGATLSAQDLGTDGDPRLGTAIPFDGAADIALAPNGDLYVADPGRHRIYRVVHATGAAEVIAGTGVAGYAGDGQDVRTAVLNAPGAVAISPEGDVFIADTQNDRVRVIRQRTGRITTLAGRGRASDGADLGDGGLATRALLSRPSGLAVDRDGHVYVADAGHHRIRRIDAVTGMISTIAGTGVPGGEGDGGPAIRAQLNTPTGIAVVSHDSGVVVYVAESGTDRVRVIDSRGNIAGVPGVVVAPVRVAFHPAGWLYVKDGSPDGVSALEVPAGAE